MEDHVEERKEQILTSGDLVIEENTIYEIDQECLSCLEKRKNGK